MIKLNNVDFSYGKTEVLKDFSLQINKKDRICLFGESGSGKTTILRLILGLETPLNGEIQKAKNLKPAVVFQEDRLIPFKTVLENITLFGADEETALFFLEKLGLKDYANKMPSDLSGRLTLEKFLCEGGNRKAPVYWAFSACQFEKREKGEADFSLSETTLGGR